MNDLHKLHKNVQAALSGVRAEYKIHDHSEMSPEITSPQDFATALGYPIQRITKALFLWSQDRQTYTVAVCSADCRLNFKSTAEAIGAKRTEFASAEDLHMMTGYPAGAVSPLGLADSIPVVIDRPLFDYPTILIGGGATGIEIELSPSDLMIISGAKPESITK